MTADLRRPAPIVLVPAAQLPSLRGRRVVIGTSRLGWRGDLRADDPVVHGNRTYVPVLTEQDYYRAETEHLEVFAPLVPVDRVWVEETVPPDHLGSAAPLDSPPRRDAIRPTETDRITGRRVVQLVPDDELRDLRALTEVHQGDDGGSYVRVCTEAEWYRWALVGDPPNPTELRVDEAWLE
jgi:hypothetical protein